MASMSAIPFHMKHLLSFCRCTILAVRMRDAASRFGKASPWLLDYRVRILPVFNRREAAMSRPLPPFRNLWLSRLDFASRSCRPCRSRPHAMLWRLCKAALFYSVLIFMSTETAVLVSYPIRGILLVENAYSGRSAKLAMAITWVVNPPTHHFRVATMSSEAYQ